MKRTNPRVRREYIQREREMEGERRKILQRSSTWRTAQSPRNQLELTHPAPLNLLRIVPSFSRTFHPAARWSFTLLEHNHHHRVEPLPSPPPPPPPSPPPESAIVPAAAAPAVAVAAAALPSLPPPRTPSHLSLFLSVSPSLFIHLSSSLSLYQSLPFSSTSAAPSASPAAPTLSRAPRRLVLLRCQCRSTDCFPRKVETRVTRPYIDFQLVKGRQHRKLCVACHREPPRILEARRLRLRRRLNFAPRASGRAACVSRACFAPLDRRKIDFRFRRSIDRGRKRERDNRVPFRRDLECLPGITFCGSVYEWER